MLRNNDKVIYARVSTFLQELVARAYTTVENILARTFYPLLALVLTLTESLSVVAH